MKEKDGENLCQIFTNILKNTSANIQLVYKLSQKSVKMFLVSNSVFIISRIFVFIIDYQTSFQE